MQGPRKGKSVGQGLVRLSGHDGPGLTLQEVEIDSQMGLLHVVDIHLHVAARVVRRRWRPGGTASGQLLIGDVQVQPAASHVELDHVAVLHQRQGAADGRLG